MYSLQYIGSHVYIKAAVTIIIKLITNLLVGTRHRWHGMILLTVAGIFKITELTYTSTLSTIYFISVVSGLSRFDGWLVSLLNIRPSFKRCFWKSIFETRCEIPCRTWTFYVLSGCWGLYFAGLYRPFSLYCLIDSVAKWIDATVPFDMLLRVCLWWNYHPRLQSYRWEDISKFKMAYSASPSNIFV